jgi:hypothetical protein
MNQGFHKQARSDIENAANQHRVHPIVRLVCYGLEDIIKSRVKKHILTYVVEAARLRPESVPSESLDRTADVFVIREVHLFAKHQ